MARGDPPPRLPPGIPTPSNTGARTWRSRRRGRPGSSRKAARTAPSTGSACGTSRRTRPRAWTCRTTPTTTALRPTGRWRSWPRSRGGNWDLYDPDSIALAPNPDLPRDAPPPAASNLAELRRYADFSTVPEPWEGSLNEADARRLKHGYYASVSYVDAMAGRLLDRLDSLGLGKNTIVVLWGDHGYKLGEMNGWAKMTNYLIDTHSPLIIRAPGVVPGGLRLEQLVELVDVYPTLSELAGLPVPAGLQGTSAVPLMRQPDRPWKRAVFSQFMRRGRWVGQDGIETMGYSMRTERYHYVAWMNRATRRITARELYDLRADSLETTNLAPTPSRSVHEHESP